MSKGQDSGRDLLEYVIFADTMCLLQYPSVQILRHIVGRENIYRTFYSTTKQQQVGQKKQVRLGHFNYSIGTPVMFYIVVIVPTEERFILSFFVDASTLSNLPIKNKIKTEGTQSNENYF